MGIEIMGPPPELVEKLREAFSLTCFVETGTLHGATTMWASTVFERVYTIEASPHFYEKAQERFSTKKNITSMLGDSGPGLYQLLPSLPPTLFFLDAHWSGGATAGEEAECPLLTELALIMPWLRKHVILVDDARLFLAPPPAPHKVADWPSLDDIIIATRGAAYVAHYRDVLIICPQAFKPVVSSIIQHLLVA